MTGGLGHITPGSLAEDGEFLKNHDHSYLNLLHALKYYSGEENQAKNATQTNKKLNISILDENEEDKIKILEKLKNYQLKNSD